MNARRAVNVPLRPDRSARRNNLPLQLYVIEGKPRRRFLVAQGFARYLSQSATLKMPKETVLFVCTHNSARSQMAEGLLRARHGNRYEVFSAGTAPSTVHPFAIEAMRDLGIDLSGHRSDHVDAYAAQPMDHVVTVCDAARETCPYLPARKRNLHHSFEDPSAVAGTDAQRLAAFRRIRDEIDAWLEATFALDGKAA